VAGWAARSGREGHRPSGRRVAGSGVGVGGSGGEGHLPPGRRVAGWGGSGGEGRVSPGISVRATIICPHNREQSILSFEK